MVGGITAIAQQEIYQNEQRKREMLAYANQRWGSTMLFLQVLGIDRLGVTFLVYRWDGGWGTRWVEWF